MTALLNPSGLRLVVPVMKARHWAFCKNDSQGCAVARHCRACARSDVICAFTLSSRRTQFWPADPRSKWNSLSTPAHVTSPRSMQRREFVGHASRCGRPHCSPQGSEGLTLVRRLPLRSRCLTVITLLVPTRGAVSLSTILTHSQQPNKRAI